MLPTLQSWPENITVVLRADLNVPLATDNTIIDDFRLQAIRPTLDYLLARKNKVIILSHLGSTSSPSLPSNQILIPWFAKHNYPINFIESFENSTNIIQKSTMRLFLFENLRLFPEEHVNDTCFAQRLANFGQYFVQDAFGSLHNHDSSIIQLPTFFHQNNKSIGFCVEKELAALKPLRHSPQRPFIVLLGGGKVNKKIQYIQDLTKLADTIMLNPAIVFSFLAAQGKNVGCSKFDTNVFATCRNILDKNKDNVSFPIDYLVCNKEASDKLFVIQENEFKDVMMGISLGPQSLQHMTAIFQQAHTIFLNGLIGFYNNPPSLAPFNELISSMTHTNARTIVAGGDSVAQTRTLDCASKIHHLSTGGGSALAYISGHELVGLSTF